MTQSPKKAKGYLSAVGRRKTASARVRFYTGVSQGSMVTVNEKAVDVYFPKRDAEVVSEPIRHLAQELGGYFTVKVNGGGVHSQAHAIRHGIARVLILLNPEWRKLFKAKRFLTRDSRMKERKKPGLRRARRAPQWSKR